jgi:TldD protein
MSVDSTIEEVARRGVEVAQALGATYADVRFGDIRSRHIRVRDERAEAIAQTSSAGIAVRVIVDGCWGFAATPSVDMAGIERAAKLAVAVAASSSLAAPAPVRLSELEPAVATYRTPVEEDPFDVPLEDTVALLLAANAAARTERGVSGAVGTHAAWERDSLFVSSEGARIEQRIVQTGAGIEVRAIADGQMQRRSYPNVFGGDHGATGYELVRAIDLVGNAPRVASEAVQLLTADDCESGVTTVVLDGSQTALQVHESVGHAVELDRILGMEAAMAGTSFVRTDDRGSLRYGSPAMNIVADATTPGALATFGFDDDGVPACSVDIVKEGILRGFLTSRETATTLGPGERSGGTVRADSWSSLPLIRMNNVSLLPGDASSMDELLDGIDRGVYMETNMSWSIDDRRVNFQFGTEFGREIVNGRLGKVLKNCSYGGNTVDFWNSLVRTGDASMWRAWGLAACGKGEPGQIGFVAHGAAPSRFAGVQVGVLR